MNEWPEIIFGASLIIMMIILLSLKYKSIVNPPVFVVVYYSFPLIFISYLNSYLIGVNGEHASTAYKISVVYILSFCVGAMVKSNYVIHYLMLFSKYTISANLRVYNVANMRLRLNICLSLCILFFTILLAHNSEWITMPRSAYMNREGLGVYWSMFATLIPICFIMKLSISKPMTSKRVLINCLPYLLLAYFTGSKQTLLSLILVSVFYVNYNIGKISFIEGAGVLVTTFAIFSIMLLVHGSFGELADSLGYFDHNAVTASALEYVHKNNMDPGIGRNFISSLWSYAPRVLFPEKPYAYGVLDLNNHLFPHAAETGYTPAVYNWFSAYLDFREVGVFFSGFTEGILLTSMTYVYLKKRQPFIFIILSGFAFMSFNMPTFMQGVTLSFILLLNVSIFVRKND